MKLAIIEHRHKHGHDIYPRDRHSTKEVHDSSVSEVDSGNVMVKNSGERKQEKTG